LDIDFTKIHSPTDLAIAVQLQKYVNVLDLTTGGDATESRPMVRGRNRPKLVSNNLVLVWGFQTGYNCSDMRGLVSGVLGATSSITGLFFLDESSAVIHFRNEQVAAEFIHKMEKTMSVSSNCLSSQNPVTTLLYAGGTNAAASYDIYEQICDFDPGIVDIKANLIEFQGSPQTVHADPMSGASTTLFTLMIDRGMTFEAASELYSCLHRWKNDWKILCSIQD